MGTSIGRRCPSHLWPTTERRADGSSPPWASHPTRALGAARWSSSWRLGGPASGCAASSGPADIVDAARHGPGFSDCDPRRATAAVLRIDRRAKPFRNDAHGRGPRPRHRPKAPGCILAESSGKAVYGSVGARKDRLRSDPAQGRRLARITRFEASDLANERETATCSFDDEAGIAAPARLPHAGLQRSFGIDGLPAGERCWVAAALRSGLSLL